VKEVIWENIPARIGQNRRFVENESKTTVRGYDNAVVREFIAGFPTLPRDIDRNDFVRIPWGSNPNFHLPVGAPSWGAPSICLRLTVGGPLILTWNFEKDYYEDVSTLYTLFFDTSWKFQTPLILWDFNITESQSPLCRVWPDGYTFGGTKGPALDYRILRYDHNMDDFGDYHSTHIMAELEDDSGGDNA